MKPLTEREVAILYAALKHWLDCETAGETLEIAHRDGRIDQATIAEVWELAGELFMA